MGMVSVHWTNDDQQSGEHFPSGSSSAVHDQLYAVTDLWLVQLPSIWKDMPAQHTRHTQHTLDSCVHAGSGLVLPTRHASSTHTTLRWSPTRPILSMTMPGAGGAASSRKSSKLNTNSKRTAWWRCGKHNLMYKMPQYARVFPFFASVWLSLLPHWRVNLNDVLRFILALDYALFVS